MRRLSRNVVAIVVIMGLSVIPCLYAWFNILSNWDPYGSEAMSNLQIGIFSEDKGVEISAFELNVGDSIISELHGNKDIGWQFPKTEDELMEGLYSGKYYAGFVIPSDFTEDLMSFISGTPKNPEIQFYCNSKKNAVATKITSKVKTAIQRELNSSILGEVALYATEGIQSLAGEDGRVHLGQILLADLENVDRDLSSCLTILDSLVVLNESVSATLNSAEAVIPAVGNVISGSRAAGGILWSGNDAAGRTTEAVIQMTDSSILAMIENLNAVSSQVGLISSGTDIQTITDTIDEILNSRAFQETKKFLDSLSETPIAATEAYKKALEIYNDLVSSMEAVKSSAEDLKADAEEIKNTLQDDISRCVAVLQSALGEFDNSVAPALWGVINDASNTLSNADELLSSVDADFSSLKKVLEDYKTTLEKGTSAFENTGKYAEGIRDDVRKLIKGLRDVRSTDAYKQLLSVLNKDAGSVSDFISAPVVLNEKIFYEIGNYGSDMSPFYTILGIWAGALLMIALIKVRVIDHEEMKDVKPWQKFFGRYILFFIIGQVQAILTVLGDLFFIGIDCAHPLLFLLTAMICSFVFTILMYSLTVAFRQVGQAVVVVILVIQVAGAGGTFPIEMLPKIYRAVYKFLPFNYGMNAMRECVGGMYGNAYIQYIGMLLIFAAVAVVIGLTLRRPFERMFDMIDRSKEKSGVML